MASKPGDLAGTERAAILLMSLGEQDAASLLKQLDARDVQKVGAAMAELNRFPQFKVRIGRASCRERVFVGV